MSYSGDGRATFRYGAEVKPGETHVEWLRVGGHEIFARPEWRPTGWRSLGSNTVQSAVDWSLPVPLLCPREFVGSIEMASPP